MQTNNNVHKPSYKNIPESCMWCPRACGANRHAGKRGACGATDEVHVARAALHFWEEPPISGKSGSGAIFFSHCTLRCIYCQNYEISSSSDAGDKAALGVRGVPISLNSLAETFLSLQHKGAMNINLVTPTHYTGMLIEAIELARARGLALPIVWNTSGYETENTIEKLKGYVDVFLTDFKYATPALAKKYSGDAQYPNIARAALRKMMEIIEHTDYDTYNGQERLTKGVVIRHLLLPGCVEDSKQVIDILHEEIGASKASEHARALLSLMNQYTPVVAAEIHKCHKQVAHACPELMRKVTNSEYEEVLDYADSVGFDNYFWQDGQPASESFIPFFDLTGVCNEQ